MQLCYMRRNSLQSILNGSSVILFNFYIFLKWSHASFLVSIKNRKHKILFSTIFSISAIAATGIADAQNSHSESDFIAFFSYPAMHYRSYLTSPNKQSYFQEGNMSKWVKTKLHKPWNSGTRFSRTSYSIQFSTPGNSTAEKQTNQN